jgi:hypothetical protein
MIERIGDIVVVKLPIDICFYESKGSTSHANPDLMASFTSIFLSTQAAKK